MIPVGTLLNNGRYEIESPLGGGGFSNTYLVIDHAAFGRQCVLKELLAEHEGNPKARELFEREGRTLSRLKHAGIPHLETFFVDGDRYFLVEALVHGRTLEAVLDERGSLLEPEVIRIARSVLEILCYLHEHTPPVVHRDIKPSNLMVTDRGDYFLIDFGAVREALHPATGPSADSTIIGTVGYAAPEQRIGRAYPASDLYSLGATLLHALTGQSPLEWYKAHRGRSFYEGVQLSHGFAPLLARLLEESLAERYPSARAVLEDLNRLEASGRTVLSPSSKPAASTHSIQAGSLDRTIVSISPKPPVTTHRARSGYIVGGGAAVLALLIIVPGLQGTRKDVVPPSTPLPSAKPEAAPEASSDSSVADDAQAGAGKRGGHRDLPLVDRKAVEDALRSLQRPATPGGERSRARGWLGVGLQPVTPDIAESLGLDDTKGALVVDVVEEGPAAAAGLRQGDVVVEFDGETVDSSADLPLFVARTPVGKTVSLKVIRDGSTETLSVAIGELEEDEEEVAEADPSALPAQEIGLTVGTLTPYLAGHLGLERTMKGVAVIQVAAGGPAWVAGFRRGDVILEVNRRPVEDVEAYRTQVENAATGKNVLFIVHRGENSIFLYLKPAS